MKILFFAPHAGIWVHAFPEALIAESLAKAASLRDAMGGAAKVKEIVISKVGPLEKVAEEMEVELELQVADEAGVKTTRATTLRFVHVDGKWRVGGK